MLGRHLRTKLDLIRPDSNKRVREAQNRQKDLGTEVDRSFESGSEVWIRQYRSGDKWLPGKVVEKLGTTDYKVLDSVGKEAHRHVDQLRRRSARTSLSVSLPTKPSDSNPPEVY
ncbi:hypothetical protein ACJJTC_008654 [Scirpophaga incertulas]